MASFQSDILVFIQRMADAVECGERIKDDDIRRLVAIFNEHDHGEGRDCRMPLIHKVFKPRLGYEDSYFNVGVSKDGSIGGGRIGVI